MIIYCVRCEKIISDDDILAHREEVAYHLSCLIASFLDDIQELKEENQLLKEKLNDNRRGHKEVDRE